MSFPNLFFGVKKLKKIIQIKNIKINIIVDAIFYLLTFLVALLSVFQIINALKNI